MSNKTLYGNSNLSNKTWLYMIKPIWKPTLYLKMAFFYQIFDHWHYGPMPYGSDYNTKVRPQVKCDLCGKKETIKLLLHYYNFDVATWDWAHNFCGQFLHYLSPRKLHCKVTNFLRSLNSM